MASYSTVRALYGGYSGPLYQVTPGSNGATADIGVLSVGGYANAATQDSFCANTVCTITRVYDQSPNHNDLTCGSEPESIYAVASGTLASNACCFDFGNVETTPTDTGPGHMDALIVSTFCSAAPCSGTGPWIQADLEDGVFMGKGSSNPAAVSQTSPFITAILRNNGTTGYALDGGNATAPSLTSLYDGAYPPGYGPMHLEGGIAL